MGNMGLFADGSVENSSYDLMKDMETLHSVIFAKSLPYNGRENQAARSVANWLKAPPESSLNLGNDSSGTWDEGSPSAVPTVTQSGLLDSMACSSGDTVGGIDAALAADLANQLGYGQNSESFGTPDALSGALSWTGSN